MKDVELTPEQKIARRKQEIDFREKIRRGRRAGPTHRGVFDSFTRALVRACGKPKRTAKQMRRSKRYRLRMAEAIDRWME